MPKWVSDLLTSWRGQVKCGNIMEAWRLAPLCLMCSFEESGMLEALKM